jgi:glycine dehydrogenase subunit 1
MRYLPHTNAEIRQMLDVIGVGSIDDLFESVPAEARFAGSLAIPEACSEGELMQHVSELAAKNTGATQTSFLGAGMYSHHIPPAVDHLLLRSEFYTAYTPYQPEVAQGTLQAIWEFQTIVSELYGLPLANASMYDGATAAAEAVQMARRLTKRSLVLVSQCVHPQYREVIRTFLSGQGPEACRETPASAGAGHDLAAIEQSLKKEAGDVAAVVVGYPAFNGALTDLTPLAKLAADNGALLITSTSEPYSLAVAKSPGEMGVDIATGEGQALACPPTFGGPGVGLFACRDGRKFLQQMPGRICGETNDANGRRGFVLTLSTREQHIRRERATSNICTNQGLLALSLAIRTSMLGKSGFVEAGKQCLSKAHYVHDAICKLDGYESATVAPFFNEFSVRVRGGDAAAVVREASKQGVIAGYDLGRSSPPQRDLLLIAVTERHRRAQLDELVRILDSI